MSVRRTTRNYRTNPFLYASEEDSETTAVIPSSSARQEQMTLDEEYQGWEDVDGNTARGAPTGVPFSQRLRHLWTSCKNVMAIHSTCCIPIERKEDATASHGESRSIKRISNTDSPIVDANEQFPPNIIRNQKYSVITFVPLVLYQQFRFFFNLYFLMVAMSQLIPVLRIGFLFTYVAPLVFVLCVTMLKEAYDDYSRYRRDTEANNEIFSKVTVRGIVGDIIHVESGKRLPADLVILSTSEDDGRCFIKTDQLDGETDWKIPAPIKNIYEFTGRIDLYPPGTREINTIGTNTSPSSSQTSPETDDVGGGGRMEPLDLENTAWSNCVVAAGNVTGVVVYTGAETRSMLNTSPPRSKIGKTDEELNFFSKVLFLLLVTMALVLLSLKGWEGPWYIYLARYILLFSSIIPISLRVNLDLGKTAYSYFMMSDKDMAGITVRSTTIPEELGRVGYVLTDKTGTLTQNEMIFKKALVGMGTQITSEMMSLSRKISEVLMARLGASSGVESPVAQTAESSAAGVKQRTGRSADIVLSEQASNDVVDMLLAMAVCHSVSPIWPPKEAEETGVTKRRGNPEYQASSPDEIALVKHASSLGLVLWDRTQDEIIVKVCCDGFKCSAKSGITVDESGIYAHFKVHQVFPFRSESKRMGIILTDPFSVSGRLVFLVKGADVVMREMCVYADWLDENVDALAREGLRTLVFGSRVLTSQVYGHFNERYTAAQNALEQRSQEMQRVQESLERELQAMGVSGVEDLLQRGVRTSLESLRQAGIKVWMLTGDKVETAKCIARSSQLVGRGDEMYTIAGVTNAQDAARALHGLDKSSGNIALVVDGTSLSVILEFCPQLFLDEACRCPAVVCCRCSPTQKAMLALALRQYRSAGVCCIGDGGNDVSMIQAATVGVGLVGKEGKQASLASDYSLTEFRHLTRLLLWHGRLSYIRTAQLSQFVIHRGLIIAVVQALFSSFFFFAAIAIYNGWILVRIYRCILSH